MPEKPVNPYPKPLGSLTLGKVIKDAQHLGEVIKAPDGEGLYFIADPQDGRSCWWRFDYRFAGKQKTLSLGTYPETGLADAREGRAGMRKALAAGIDPGAQRKAEKISLAGADSFQAIAMEWWEHNEARWTEGHSSRVLALLKADVFPYIGKAHINGITAPELLSVIRRIEGRGAVETGHRARQHCEGVFAFAIATGRCDNNPGSAIKKALLPISGKKNFARVKGEANIAALLRAIDEYTGTHVVRCALRLAPLTFVRPGELRQVEWEHVDWDKAMLTIPAENKKQTADRKRDATNTHLVPLSRQAMDILKELHPLTGGGRYAFPSARTPNGSRPMSNVALLAALRRMGFSKDEMTAHGFRGIASTQLREAGKGRFRHEVIEAQLAHSVRNQVEAAYNHAEYLDERAAMMQWWADYLAGLKKGAEIIPLKKAV